MTRTPNEPKKPRFWRRFWRRAAYSLLVLLLGGLALAWTTAKTLKDGGYIEPWDDSDGEIVRNVSYGPENWQKLDLFLPKNLAPEKSRGFVLFAHGGAWVVGKRFEENGPCKRCAKAGFIAASFDYRSFREKRKEGYSFEVVLDEFAAALETVRNELEKRGIEVDRAGLSGISAGGHLAMLYSYSRGFETTKISNNETKDDKNSILNSNENRRRPLKIAFVAPRVGPCDFHCETWPTLSAKRVAYIVSRATQTEITPEELTNGSAEKLVDSISPASFVEKGRAIPTLAAYGGKDRLVPPTHRAKLVAAFANVPDVPFEIVDYPNSGHLLADDPESFARFHRLFLDYAEKYLTDADSSER